MLGQACEGQDLTQGDGLPVPGDGRQAVWPVQGPEGSPLLTGESAGGGFPLPVGPESLER